MLFLLERMMKRRWLAIALSVNNATIRRGYSFAQTMTYLSFPRRREWRI